MKRKDRRRRGAAFIVSLTLLSFGCSPTAIDNSVAAPTPPARAGAYPTPPGMSTEPVIDSAQCLVGTWRSVSINSAVGKGGGGIFLTIKANGEASVDYTLMETSVRKVSSWDNNISTTVKTTGKGEAIIKIDTNLILLVRNGESSLITSVDKYSYSPNMVETTTTTPELGLGRIMFPPDYVPGDLNTYAPATYECEGNAMELRSGTSRRPDLGGGYRPITNFTRVQ